MRVPLSVGLGLVVGYPVIVVLVSAFGFTNHTVWGVGAIGLMPFLFGAIAWIQPSRRRRDFYRLLRQRNALLCCLAFVVAIPLTRWPLWLSLALVGHRMEALVTEGVQSRYNHAKSEAERFGGLLGDWPFFFDGEPARGNWQCGLFRIYSYSACKTIDGNIVFQYELAPGTTLKLYILPGLRRWEIEEP